MDDLLGHKWEATSWALQKNIHKGYFQCISYNLLAANRQNIQQTKPPCYAIYPYVLDSWGNSQDLGEGVAEFGGPRVDGIIMNEQQN